MNQLNTAAQAPHINPNETYYGAGLTPDECDTYEELFVAPRLKIEEPELGRSCWFDYRHTHAVIRTFKFAAHYRYLYSIKRAERGDNADGPGAARRGFTGDDIFQSPLLVYMWTARQHADRYTIPYSLYIRYVFECAEQRRWRRLPAAQQLYQQVFIDHAISRWSETMLSDHAPLPESERYLAFNFDEEDEDKAEFQLWLMDWLKTRKNDTVLIYTLLFERCLVCPQMLVQNFGQDALRRVTSYARRLRAAQVA